MTMHVAAALSAGRGWMRCAYYLGGGTMQARISCLHVLQQQALQQATGVQLGEHVWARHRGIPQKCHPSRLQQHFPCPDLRKLVA